MVQNAEVNRLRQAWEAKGDPPCDHPEVAVEFYLGSKTGDYACLVCGESWPKRFGRTPPANWLEIVQAEMRQRHPAGEAER